MQNNLILALVLCVLISTKSVAQKLDSLLDDFVTLSAVEDSIENYIRIADYILDKDPQKGLTILNEAAEILNRTFDKDLVNDFFYKQALLTRNSGRHKEALELFEKYIMYYSKTDKLEKLTEGYQSAGSLYMREKEYEKSQTYLEIAKENYIKLGYDRGLGRAYRSLGSLARRRSDFPKALEYYLKAKDVFERIHDESNLSKIHNSLGILYSSVGDKENASEHFIKTYEISISRGEKLRAANALNNFSSTVTSDAEARIYMFKSLALFEELNLAKPSGMMHYNIGQSYARKEDLIDSALIHYVAALKHYKKSNTEPPQQLKQGMAKAYGSVGQKQKALKLLKEIEDEIDESHEVHFLHNSYGVISNTYASIGKYEDAFNYRVKLQDVKDSIFTLEKTAALAEISTNYEVKEKDLRIENLETKSKFNELKISRRNILGTVLGASLLVLGFFFRQIKKKNEKIESQNEIITESLLEKEALLNEIHHRVKNNLQIISSLLNIQSRSIVDSKAKEALLVGKNRVHSMSLIHQNLYDEENLSGILLSNYLPTLVEDLCHTYSTSTGEIQVETNIDAIEVDIDTVIPIGLIVNELITNCLKYAFPNNRNGKISINLAEYKDYLSLSVLDNGIGLTNIQLQERLDSFGHKIIRAFKEKLKAEIEITNDNGTQVHLIIKSYKKIRTGSLSQAS